MKKNLHLSAVFSITCGFKIEQQPQRCLYKKG